MFLLANAPIALCRFYDMSYPSICGFVLHLFILCRNTSLIQIAGRKAYFVIPIDGEGVEAERTEIIKVLQLAANAFLHERREVHQADFARAECQAQGVVTDILGGGFFVVMSVSSIYFNGSIFLAASLFDRRSQFSISSSRCRSSHS